jgi:hypothetical protein
MPPQIAVLLCAALLGLCHFGHAATGSLWRKHNPSSRRTLQAQSGVEQQHDWLFPMVQVKS